METAICYITHVCMVILGCWCLYFWFTEWSASQPGLYDPCHWNLNRSPNTKVFDSVLWFYLKETSLTCHGKQELRFWTQSQSTLKTLETSIGNLDKHSLLQFCKFGIHISPLLSHLLHFSHHSLELVRVDSDILNFYFWHLK